MKTTTTRRARRTMTVSQQDRWIEAMITAAKIRYEAADRAKKEATK